MNYGLHLWNTPPHEQTYFFPYVYLFNVVKWRCHVKIASKNSSKTSALPKARENASDQHLIGLKGGACFRDQSQNGFNRGSNSELLLFCFTSSRDWFRKLKPFSLPIIFKTKTNRDLVTSVFPRLRQVARFSLEFLLTLSFRPSGRCDYFEFGFTTLQRNWL